MSTDLTLKIVCNNSNATEQLGQTVGHNLRGGETIELVSDLGGGKTTFTRGLVAGTGSKDAVTSPTFKVCNVYKVDPGSSHSDGMQGAAEQHIEPYLKYGERAAQAATKQSAESTSRVSGSDRKQASAVREIWHFDFYRLQDPGLVANELSENIDDKKAVTVVEWADNVRNVLPKQRLRIVFKSVSSDSDERAIELQAPKELEYLVEGLE